MCCNIVGSPHRLAAGGRGADAKGSRVLSHHIIRCNIAYYAAICTCCSVHDMPPYRAPARRGRPGSRCERGASILISYSTLQYRIICRNIAKICRHIAHRLGAGGRGANEVEAQGVGAVHAHHLLRVRVVFEPLYRAYIYI